MCRIGGFDTRSHDGGGKPPFPLVSEMTPEQLEFARQTLDYILLGETPGILPTEIKVVGEVIGYLKEFAEQQKKPASEAFQLPN